MEKVSAKKHLGQHFLKDESIAKDIADTLSLEGYSKILEDCLCILSFDFPFFNG